MKELGRDFLLFRIGQALSMLGGRCSHIALAWWVIEETKSPTLLAAILAPSMFVNIILTPLMGPAGDIFPRKYCAVLADIWCFVFSFVLALLALLGIFDPIWIVILSVLSSIGTALLSPVMYSIVTTLVPKEHTQKAMATGSLINSIGFILGAILGGILVAFVGIPVTLLLNALSFLIAAILTSIIRQTSQSFVNKDKEYKKLVAKWFRNVGDGVRAMWKIPLEMYSGVLVMIVNFFLTSFLVVILPSYVERGLGMPAWYFGALQASFGLGIFLTSSWLLEKFNERIPKDIVCIVGTFTFGMCIALVGWTQELKLLPVLLIGVGIGLTAINVNMRTQRILAIPDEYRTRLSACRQFLIQITIPLGVAYAGVSLKYLDFSTSIRIHGLGIMVVSLLYFFVPKYSKFMRSNTKQVENFYVEHYPQAFR
ncbi:MFS transporter [Candidatus Uabimicrobium amorphum]|uniref:Permease n=1 Tax=Uabimicrobium amorphum TaxID=2596890 RepID=A0A5S9IK11_UABAM|nr:MFS transporter [Candidatus Uabimicrobium amorphum]BBM83124.1 permease [Candidatus Uabimicrobium amorphum]